MKDNEFQKELLDTLIKGWTTEQIEIYIITLQERANTLNDWIKYLKSKKRNRIRKMPVDTGTRGGL